LLIKKVQHGANLALDKNMLDNQSIKPIILQNLSMIKRPLLVLDNNEIVLGFDVEQWQNFAQEHLISLNA
jgi:arsenate reductase-like glutaredoxin family protein